MNATSLCIFVQCDFHFHVYIHPQKKPSKSACQKPVYIDDISLVLVQLFVIENVKSMSEFQQIGAGLNGQLISRKN